MSTTSRSQQQDRAFEQDQKYAIYDPNEGIVCHHDGGVAISDNQDELATELPAVADQMDLPKDQLEIVRLTITPADAPTEDAATDEQRETETDLTAGSVTVKRGPHRRKSELVEYREAEDGAWAVKTPEDDEFWIFICTLAGNV